MAQAFPRSLSLGRRRSTQASCARAPCRAGCGRLMPMEAHCVGEGPLSFGARLWCDVPTVRSNAKPAPNVTRRRRACARCILGGGAAFELAARARRAALAMVCVCLEEGHRPGESPVSFDERPWCDVKAAVFNPKLVSRDSRGAGVSKLAVSRGRRSTQANFACAPCRASCGLPMPRQRELRRREVSLLPRALVMRRARCELQRQASAACHAAQVPHARLHFLCL